jgi:hypothetical protein
MSLPIRYEHLILLDEDIFKDRFIVPPDIIGTYICPSADLVDLLYDKVREGDHDDGSPSSFIAPCIMWK